MISNTASNIFLYKSFMEVPVPWTRNLKDNLVKSYISIYVLIYVIYVICMLYMYLCIDIEIYTQIHI